MTTPPKEPLACTDCFRLWDLLADAKLQSSLLQHRLEVARRSNNVAVELTLLTLVRDNAEDCAELERELQAHESQAHAQAVEVQNA